MESTKAAASPARIMEVGMAFWASRVLHTAVKLELFTILGDTSMTGRELAAELGLHERSNPDFFDTLVALRFLEREGDGADGKYRNTVDTTAFLDRNEPQYIGGFFEMAHDRIYPFWGDLIEALRTGKPQNEIKHTGKTVFEELYSDQDRLEQFMNAMAGISRPNFQALAEKVDFSAYSTLCDVGGAAATLSMVVAAKNPHLKCVSADLPPACAVADKKIAEAGMSDRIATRHLDFFKEPLPAADVITMGMILHDWDLEKKKHLVKAAYDALPEGGAFIVIENIIDDARRENAFGLMMSLNMLVEFGDAFDFTGADLGSWCREAGFRRTEIVHLNGPASAGIAYK